MTIKNYSIGLVLSLMLTLAAYALVELHIANHHEWPAHGIIILAVIVFAFLQCVVQAVFFLHLNTRAASRDRLIVLGFAVTVVLILVLGSLWIMFNLNQRMMPTDMQMTEYMDSQQGI